MLEHRSKIDNGRQSGIKKVDTKEFELPETTFIRDIDTKVFQGIVLQCLAQIPGIALVEGNFIDNFLGRSTPEVSNGIHSQQDSNTHSVSIKIEVNICYGIPLPEKAEEIQAKVAEEITRLTGLHVSSVHIVFKDLIIADQTKRMLNHLDQFAKEPKSSNNEYSDVF